MHQDEAHANMRRACKLSPTNPGSSHCDVTALTANYLMYRNNMQNIETSQLIALKAYPSTAGVNTSDQVAVIGKACHHLML